MKVIVEIVLMFIVFLREGVIRGILSALYYRKRNIEKYIQSLKKIGIGLCNALPKFGPAFTKLGQFLATRDDLLHSILCDELKNLQDNVSAIKFSKIEKILKCELSEKLNDLEIEAKPVAAASVAQVHIGFIGNVKVAVKILRPNARRLFKKNLSMMLTVAEFLHKFISPAKRLRLTEIVNVIAETANAELNMRIEAAASDKIRYNLIDQPTIFIPKVFWEYTTSSVLVTEWVNGRKIDTCENSEKAAETLAFAFFHQAYVNGFFHADLHAGNLLICDDGRIALLDFGMCSYLPERDRLFLAEIIYAFVHKDYDRAAELHLNAHYVPYKKNEYEKTRNNFALACRTIAEPIFGKAAANVSISKLLKRLFEVTAEFNMQTQPQLILLQKNMVLLESVLIMLDSNVNMWKLIEPWFTDWAKNNLNFTSEIQRTYTKILKRLRMILENDNLNM